MSNFIYGLVFGTLTAYGALLVCYGLLKVRASAGKYVAKKLGKDPSDDIFVQATEWCEQRLFCRFCGRNVRGKK